MSGGVSIDSVKQAITSGLQPDNLVVYDTSDGCGSKFQLFVSSDRFDGVSLVERHRLVTNALSDYMTNIHAVEIKAWTKQQWEQRKNTIPGYTEQQ